MCGRSGGQAALVPLPAARAALSFLASRLRLREAVLRWIVPLVAIRSRRCVVLFSSSLALSNCPAVSAALNPLRFSLSSSLRYRLCARRLAFWRTRFLAEIEWATEKSPRVFVKGGVA